MSYFRLKHNTINSIIEQVQEAVAGTVFSNLTILRAYSNVYAKDVKLPFMVISLESTSSDYFQIGDTNFQKDMLIIFDIYAKNEVYKEDLSDFLVEELIKHNFKYYEYSYISGTDKDLDKVQNGELIFINLISDVSVVFNEFENNEKDQHRHRISFILRRFPNV